MDGHGAARLVRTAGPRADNRCSALLRL